LDELLLERKKQRPLTQHTQETKLGLESYDTTRSSPGVKIVNDHMKHTACRVLVLLKNSSIPFFPQPPGILDISVQVLV
jgi:hypothetical protein